MSAAQLARDQKFDTARRQLTAVNKMLLDPTEGLLTTLTEKDWQDRIGNIVEGNLKSVWPVDDPRYKAYKDYVEGSMAPMIKALGESGNLAVKDVERGLKLLPIFYGAVPDNPQTARIKLKALNMLLGKQEGVSWSPDNTKMQYFDEDGSVVRFDFNTGKATRRPAGG
jgi:hypothetical protein